MKFVVNQILVLFAIVLFGSLLPLQTQAITDKVPASDHPLWGEFAKCKFMRDEVRNLTILGYTPAVRKLDQKEISISGFITPLEPAKASSHFLLSKNSPTCSFCPPSRASEVIEVFTLSPVEWKDDMFTFSGRLELSRDSRSRIMFRLNRAVLK